MSLREVFAPKEVEQTVRIITNIEIDKYEQVMEQRGTIYPIG